jgi:hypothetical protein
MSDTYRAELIGNDHTETIELQLINGLPLKSFVRPTSGEENGDEEEIVWELILGSDPIQYREAGIPQADYS